MSNEEPEPPHPRPSDRNRSPERRQNWSNRNAAAQARGLSLLRRPPCATARSLRRWRTPSTAWTAPPRFARVLGAGPTGRVSVGAQAAAATQAETVRDGVLFVRTNSSVWSHELMLHKARLLQSLNRLLGAQVISEIIFRAQGIAPPEPPADPDHPTDEELATLLLEPHERDRLRASLEALISITDAHARESIARRITYEARLRHWRLEHGWKVCPRCDALHGKTPYRICPPLPPELTVCSGIDLSKHHTLQSGRLDSGSPDRLHNLPVHLRRIFPTQRREEKALTLRPLVMFTLAFVAGVLASATSVWLVWIGVAALAGMSGIACC